MSIWGDLDIDEIGTDPFGLPENTYLFLVTDAKVEQKENRTGLVVKFQVEMPGTQYDKRPQSKYYPFYPGKKNEDLNAQELQDMERLNKDLEQAFDLSDSERKGLTPKQLVGKLFYGDVKHSQGKTGTKNEGKTFSNINNMTSQRLWEETHAAQNEADEKSYGF